MLYVARCVVPSRLLRDRLSDETKANVWPETQDPRERKDHLVAEKMSLQYIEFSFKMFNLLSLLTSCIYYSQLIRDIHTNGKEGLEVAKRICSFPINTLTLILASIPRAKSASNIFC